MARLPRYTLPGQPQHVILRGNNRNDIFVAEEDYHFFKECLEKAAKEHGCNIHAYVLMTNHVHLLLTPQLENSISKMMQSIGRRYVQYFNFRQKRSGTLWEGRYKSTLIDSERYLLTCYRYIEMNPVRAGMVSKPGEYPWSSYLCHAEGESDAVITEHDLYIALGRNKEERQQAYRSLFDSVLNEEDINAIRAATNSGWALGDGAFKERMTLQTARRMNPLPKGRPRRISQDASFEELLSLIN